MGLLDTLFRRMPAPVNAGALQDPAARNARPAMRRSYSTAGGMFAAAESSNLTASWGTSPMSADQIVIRNQRALVARSREQSANNDYAKAFLRIVRQNVVGPHGPQLQVQATKANGAADAEVNGALESAFDVWGEPANCDVTGKRGFAAIVRSSINTEAKDGEYFIRLCYGKDAGPWGFALQTIDPQRCPVELNEPSRPDGSFVRCGIHFNRYGRPLGYYFTDLAQSDENFWYVAAAGPAGSLKSYTYVEAHEVIHGFVEDMEGQKRGLPWMATGLLRMKNLNGFEDAAIINARLGASKVGVVQWKDGFGPELEDGEEVPEFSADPGEFMTLPEGAEFKDWSPQFPSGDTGPFVKHLLRGIAAGFGTPYNELAADLEGVNFSSIRQGTLDSREHWKELQEEQLIERLCVRVYRAWLPIALLRGVTTAKGRALSPAKADRYLAHKWQPRRWEWIDPSADTDSAVERKNNFLASPSQIIREQGREPAHVYVEIARDMRAQVDALVAEGFEKEKAEELITQSMGMAPPKPKPNGSTLAK